MSNPTGTNNGTKRHRFDMATGAYLQLPPDRRPYRPAKFRPAGPPAHPAPTNPSNVNSTHIWPAANANRSAPRPGTPPVDTLLPIPASGPDWRARLATTVRHMPWPARLLAVFLTACVLVVAAVILGVLS